jgi:hypothetical protein
MWLQFPVCRSVARNMDRNADNVVLSTMLFAVIMVSKEGLFAGL